MRPAFGSALAFALSLCASPSQAGLLLVQPNRYEFGFDTLAHVGPSGGGVDQAGFTAYLGPNVLDAGDDIFVQLYPDFFSDPPFSSHHFTLPTSLFAVTVVGAWQDLQGKLAFTATAGSVELARLHVWAIRAGEWYEADVYASGPPPPPSVIPEPSTTAAALFGGALVARRRRRRERG